MRHMASLLDRIIRQWLPVRGKRLLIECARRNFMESTLRSLHANGFRPEAIIDVGAYIGGWTRLARRIFPEARVLMIEPQPAKKMQLEALAAKDACITFRPALVGAAPQPAVCFFAMETGSSIYAENSGRPRDAIELPMTTLDAIADEAGFATCRDMLLKLDVQGAELHVLRGAERVMPSVALVLAEVSLVEYNLGGPRVLEVIQFMHERGFTLYDLAGFRRIRNVMGQLDLMFVREDSPLRMTWRKADRRGATS